MEPEGSLPYSSVLSHEYYEREFFYGEELLAPRTTPKLEDHP
jgi:hypothetical protein